MLLVFINQRLLQMTSTDLIAKAATTINTTADKVWQALTDPAIIKQYMFGTTVTSDWKEGSDISWKGEWKGKSYEDKGKILQLIPGKKLQYSHYSPLSGLEDKPGNYHTVTITLSEDSNKTYVVLEQDNNADEKSKEHSEQNWKMMFESLKKVLEQNN